MPMSATRTSPASGTGTEWQAFFEADGFQYAEASIDLGITILRLLHLVTPLEHIILLGSESFAGPVCDAVCFELLCVQYSPPRVRLVGVRVVIKDVWHVTRDNLLAEDL